MERLPLPHLILELHEVHVVGTAGEPNLEGSFLSRAAHYRIVATWLFLLQKYRLGMQWLIMSTKWQTPEVFATDSKEHAAEGDGDSAESLDVH